MNCRDVLQFTVFPCYDGRRCIPGAAMVFFSEPFVGGFFGLGRTYGAVLRFECTSPESLESDWPTALAEAARWRESRSRRATALHLYFQVPDALVPAAMTFVATKVLMPSAALPEPLRGLCLEVNVFTPDMSHHMHLVLYANGT